MREALIIISRGNDLQDSNGKFGEKSIDRERFDRNGMTIRPEVLPCPLSTSLLLERQHSLMLYNSLDVTKLKPEHMDGDHSSR